MKEKKLDEAQRMAVDPTLSAAEIGARCRQIFSPLFNQPAAGKDDNQEVFTTLFDESTAETKTEENGHHTNGDRVTA